MKEQCSNCMFWTSHGRIDNAHIKGGGTLYEGKCRRHAPTVGNGQPDMTMWPCTDYTDWCGEWKIALQNVPDVPSKESPYP